MSPKKPDKGPRVRKAAAKVVSRTRPTAEKDRKNLQEIPIALSVDTESLFLQVQVPERDKSCFRFFSRPTGTKPENRKLLSINVMLWCEVFNNMRKSRSARSGNQQRGRVSNCSNGKTKKLLHREDFIKS